MRNAMDSSQDSHPEAQRSGNPLERLDFSPCRVFEQLPVDRKLHEGVPNQPRPVANSIYALVPIQPLEKPKTVCVSPSAFRQIGVMHGLDDYEKLDETFAKYISGSLRIPNSPEPAAHAYCGHQFGYFSGQLGDGAAVLLGEVNGIEVQLKGSGKTPFSRSADGRKVLRSTIREFLCSEHMHALGIPTTRAAAVSASFDDLVLRDINYDGNAKLEPTAVVVRLAESFIRFGSFEIFKPVDSITGRSGPSANNTELLRHLADFVIDNYYEAECAGSEDEETKYEMFFKAVVERTARVVAKWQTVGFCHGVLNTDNMSIVGDTIDYGPFGFMEAFERDFICNTSDTGGRYAYDAQPKIGLWNCTKLAEALAPILDPEKAVNVLRATYGQVFLEEYKRLMSMKLGLTESMEGDGELIEALLDTMETTAADFTNTFRALGLVEIDKDEPSWAAALDRIVESCLTPIEQAERIKVPVQAAVLEQLKQMNPQSLPMYGISEAALRKWDADYERKRQLEATPPEDKRKADVEKWTAWLSSYAARLAKEDRRKSDDERRRQMNSINPKVVLRNHLAQRVIEKAYEGDFAPVRELLGVLVNPFSDDISDELTKRAPPDATNLAVS
ncbi:hypothetical protein FOL47_008039 [Perkinsus chesapeaki]|uniref:Selenoprotein O n=1 Tax=Perkinsus chesapeaki TaxID=330153 RepID=A0A7J6N268_PERCH|nr:hypothetical protein FOL47_008039 [Perkinsus chesapeaki]